MSYVRFIAAHEGHQAGDSADVPNATELIARGVAVADYVQQAAIGRRIEFTGTRSAAFSLEVEMMDMAVPVIGSA